ncbi:MAG: tRNA (N(6)-L-threonylcarbamoyladenosine(37)-C(2))-methylthiotransferase MtaB [Pseudomonadota bacterium]|nr:tRNA (N(6)-L-threonylcarbamoyladenosine(37)-C(2))-methylthiotransferase MtaB [Pseudomonadota bacterium]
MTVQTITLGCRLNFAESEHMKSLAPDGHTVIVNSCAVTNEAVRQTRQAIRRARRERPEARIIVTGCAAQLDPQAFAAMPEVDRVLGNAEKYRASSFRNTSPRPFVSSEVETRFAPQERPSTSLGTNGGFARVDVGDIMASPAPHVAAGFLSRVRSFVAIQTGCDHRCTFCAIWQARGPSRSLPYEAVRDAIVRELDAGAKEIVLTGVDITSYAPGLGLLCQRLLADLPALRRLRLSSLDSIEIDDALLELVAGEPRLLPHFHLSLQAGDDLILKRMKRRHSRAQAVATVAKLKAARPTVTIGADLIAGFPTESEQAARNTLALLDDCDVIAAHIFPFSPRPDTPAARMPQVERGQVKARAARLREAAAVRRTAWLDAQIGTRQSVLIENKERGHCDSFAPVRVAGSARGDLGPALITGRDGDHLIGTFE